ncbi:GntR family transcriptional regulator [bacterium]|nr:GntR family transcriptional regulator [bacterium]
MKSTNLDVQELRYQSLGDKAADIIRDRIISGEYPPGTRLAEEIFADGMGVSRACVREAFMLLEAEGLVRRVRNKHTIVATFSKQDINEILVLRYAIEFVSSEKCIEQGIVPLDALKEQLSKFNEAGSDTRALMEADLDFHEIIVRACGNSRSLHIWNCLKSQMKMLLFAALGNEKNPVRLKGADIHSEIIEALAAGDKARTHALIKMHMDGSAVSSIIIETE